MTCIWGEIASRICQKGMLLKTAAETAGWAHGPSKKHGAAGSARTGNSERVCSCAECQHSQGERPPWRQV